MSVGLPPRVVIAAPGSGSGKTAVACGLIGALRARGRRVQGFKVGPDYIDPTHHALASGRPGRNLDAFLSGPELIAPLARHGAAGADLAVVEGVMGLFDGVTGRGELASTAQVAKLLRAPVLLVLDARAVARSAAATVLGFRSFDPDLDLAGVILNRVGSDHHEAILREAIAPLGVPVLGALRRDDRMGVPERHLGLVPAVERLAATQDALAAQAAAVAERVDLAAVERIAAGAPAKAGPAWSPGAPRTARARVAVARGPAFSFHYEENLELLAAAGAELVDVDPLADEALPAGAGALVLAGGFPEVHGAELSANAALREEIAAFASAGRPVVAECGGYLYLCRDLDGRPMCGVLPARGEMTDRLTLGYREAAALGDGPCFAAGAAPRGHEFHYSRVVPEADAAPAAAWRLRTSMGAGREEGMAVGSVSASYLHTHWAATPEAAGRLVAAAEAATPARAGARWA